MFEDTGDVKLIVNDVVDELTIETMELGMPTGGAELNAELVVEVIDVTDGGMDKFEDTGDAKLVVDDIVDELTVETMELGMPIGSAELNAELVVEVIDVTEEIVVDKTELKMLVVSKALYALDVMEVELLDDGSRLNTELILDITEIVLPADSGKTGVVLDIVEVEVL